VGGREKGEEGGGERQGELRRLGGGRERGGEGGRREINRWRERERERERERRGERERMDIERESKIDCE
jgi:hypothetical protein